MQNVDPLRISARSRTLAAQSGTFRISWSPPREQLFERPAVVVYFEDKYPLFCRHPGSRSQPRTRCDRDLHGSATLRCCCSSAAQLHSTVANTPGEPAKAGWRHRLRHAGGWLRRGSDRAPRSWDSWPSPRWTRQSRTRSSPEPSRGNCATARPGAGDIDGVVCRGSTWALVGSAVVYNPVLPVRLGDKDVWIVLNFGSVFLFWYTVYRERRAN